MLVKKSEHRAQIFQNIFSTKIEHCEFCHSLFRSLVMSYHWMGGKGGCPRYFNRNAPQYRHVKFLRSIGEHRYGPPKKHVSDFFLQNMMRKKTSKIAQNENGHPPREKKNLTNPAPQ